MMGLDNPIHLAFLLIVLLLVFGAKRLPEMGHSLGSGLRGFKQAIGGEDSHIPTQASLSQEPVPVVPTQTAAPEHVERPRPIVQDDQRSDRAA
ncbi:MAG TPA: twin-arginine translocase TatA/TatE family subunit [Solirubrobacteraceae bacterium]|jgi:sec-independent protein translocase protein TatA